MRVLLACLGYFAAQQQAEAGSRVRPLSIDGCARNAAGFGGFFERQAGEEVQLDDLGDFRLLLSQAGHRLIDGQDGSCVRGRSSDNIPQFDPLQFAAVSNALLATCRSTRIRRMASAAAAKKWPRPLNC